MGLILGILAIVAGAIGIKYSIVAIVAGISALMVFFGLKKE